MRHSPILHPPHRQYCRSQPKLIFWCAAGKKIMGPSVAVDLMVKSSRGRGQSSRASLSEKGADAGEGTDSLTDSWAEAASCLNTSPTKARSSEDIYFCLGL